MSNVQLLVPNWVETNWVTLTDTGSGAFWAGLDNIRDPDFGTSARCAVVAAASTEFALDFSALATVLGAAPGFGGLLIPKSNLSPSALIRLKIGTAAFSSGGAGGGAVTYDSGLVAAFPSVVYTPGTLPWGHVSGFSGAPDPVMDVGTYNRAVVLLPPATVQGTFAWIGIDDHTNTDAQILLYRLLLAPVYEPSRNMSYGAQMSFGGSRIADESVTNAEFIDPNRQLKRVWNLTLDDLPVDEVVEMFTGLQMYLRYAKQMGLVFDAADTYHMQRRSFMVTQLKPGDIGYPYFGGSAVPLVLQEVI